MLIFLKFSIGTMAVVRSSRHRPFCFHNFVFLLSCLFVLYSRFMCVIAISNHTNFCWKFVDFLFYSTTTFTSTRRNFFHGDARNSTSTTSRCFFHDVGHQSAVFDLYPFFVVGHVTAVIWWPPSPQCGGTLVSPSITALWEQGTLAVNLWGPETALPLTLATGQGHFKSSFGFSAVPKMRAPSLPLSDGFNLCHPAYCNLFLGQLKTLAV